jgi:hypothetical protein
MHSKCGGFGRSSCRAAAERNRSGSGDYRRKGNHSGADLKSEKLKGTAPEATRRIKNQNSGSTRTQAEHDGKDSSSRDFQGSRSQGSDSFATPRRGGDSSPDHSRSRRRRVEDLAFTDDIDEERPAACQLPADVCWAVNNWDDRHLDKVSDLRLGAVPDEVDIAINHSSMCGTAQRPKIMLHHMDVIAMEHQCLLKVSC